MNDFLKMSILRRSNPRNSINIIEKNICFAAKKLHFNSSKTLTISILNSSKKKLKKKKKWSNQIKKQEKENG